MPAERYKVGRKYTERLHIAADATDPEAMLELMSELAANDHTVEARLADAECRAIAHLKRVKMPLDPKALPYGDPTWLRQNERKSLDWYAINILITTRRLRQQIECSAVTIAVDFALDLGVLATEATMIQYTVANTDRGGEGFKTSDTYLDAKRQHEEWQAQAIEIWAVNPRLTQGAVAKKIDPDPKKWRNIIRYIRDLDPRKRK